MHIIDKINSMSICQKIIEKYLSFWIVKKFLDVWWKTKAFAMLSE